MSKYLLPILGLFLFSCGSKKEPRQQQDQKEKKDEPVNLYKGPDYEAINNCLRTTLSYKMQIEPRDYDSISTYYFHEIRDYAEPEISQKNQALRRLKQTIKDSSSALEETRLKDIEGQIDILQQEVNAHYREVIGYVFVHSFSIKDKDTLSAIFVMDRSCGFKEFIIVKAISDPNPDDYIEPIRSIER